MRLSEAIRLGAMTGGQTIGALSRGDSTCALGAAYRAAGLLKRGRVRIEVAYKTLPTLGAPVTGCPRCSLDQFADVGDVIVHLNDFHMWTREQIADWVATVEPAETPDAAEQPVDVRGGLEESSTPVLALRAEGSSYV